MNLREEVNPIMVNGVHSNDCYIKTRLNVKRRVFENVDAEEEMEQSVSIKDALS